MAIFNRQTMEQITQKMMDWSRGVTTQLTDWRVGSKNRTIYEAFAIVVEDFYDKVFKGIKAAIIQNLYTAFGFTALPGTSATGITRFYAQATPDAAAPYYIALGTQVQASPTSSRSAVSYQTTKDAYIYYNSPTEATAVTIGGVSVQGWRYVDVPVVCQTVGLLGNVDSNAIQKLVGVINGIGAVTNFAKFISGTEAETLSQQKARFQLFMKSRTRGTLDSIQYAAYSANVYDPTGTFVQEQVASSITIDGDGRFDVYLWNGIGTASAALLAAAKKVIDGYTDASGNRVWGYKPAGIPYTVWSVTVVSVPLAMAVTPASGYGITDADVTAGLIDLRPAINNAVSSYFSTVKPGQTVVWAAIEGAIKQITGVYDVQLTTPAGNTVTGSTSVLTAGLPIAFTKGTTV